VVVGCGGRDPNLPKLVPVEGTITLDGKPASGTSVTFLPTGTTRGNGAVGYTDAEGKYKLSDPRDGSEGVPVGEYRVMCNKLVMPDGTDLPMNSDIPPMDSPAREVLPVNYSDMEMSELTFTVPEAGGTADFDLKSKP
ncbi:MAG: DUF4198 domain-containing protein, partial [bacterium]|nr:DUF4198 domain-containing protein [bacterium]